MKKTITILFIISALAAGGQTAYEHISRTAVYDLLDELAAEKVIQVNSVVKPYSRTFIAEKLTEALEQKEALTRRQVNDIEFYLKDYRLELEYNTSGMKPGNIFPKKDHIATSLDPIGVHYRDSVFALSVRPVWGITYFTNRNGTATHRWGGLEGFGYITKNIGLYTSLRDNRESQWLSAPEYFVQRQGVPVKGVPDGGVDFSEARGGLMASWKWGSVGVIKDHFTWGNSYYGSNIFSGRTPSFAHIKLHLKPVKWFEFNYIHGWLVSEVIDSTRSYWDGDTYREVFHSKYIAANMFTFTPVKHLNISFGNSIIYSDIGVQAAYLVPFLFYKSVDHTLNSTANNTGQNSQMFFDISSRNLKHLHLFVSVFIDEFSISRVSEKEAHNFISYKGGFRLSNWPVRNLSLITEYTFTLPMTYQHYISTTTFESNSYNLGHYMRDNSQDLYIALKYKPIRGLTIDAFYNFAQHGNDEKYGEFVPGDEVPVMEIITWQKSVLGLKARYEVVNNAYVYLGVVYSDVRGLKELEGNRAVVPNYLNKFTPPLFRGINTTLEAGFNIGF